MIDPVCKLAVLIHVARGHRLLQAQYDVRVVGMILTTMSELQETALRDRHTLLPGHVMQFAQVRLYFGKASAAHLPRSARKAELCHFAGKPDRFEQLGAAVGRDAGNAHLRQDFQQPFSHRPTVILAVLKQVAVQRAALVQVVDHLERQVGIDRRRTHAQQYCELVRVTGRARLHHDIAVAAQALTNQALVNRPNGQGGMDGNGIG